MNDNQKLKIYYIDLIRKYSIPEYMHEHVVNYIMEGYLDDNFLEAVLCNNLRDSAMYADENNQKCLFEWVRVLHNVLPCDAWGSKDKVYHWVVAGGYKQFEVDNTPGQITIQ